MIEKHFIPRFISSPSRSAVPRDRSNALLADLPQFLAQHAPQCFLKRFVGTLDVFTKRGVDQRLVVSAACLMYSGFKPLHQVLVQTNGDAGLALRRWHHGTAFGFRKVVVLAPSSS